MEVILNIGLNTNTGTPIEAIDAAQAVADAGFHVVSTEVFQSDTEPTLVVRAETRPGAEEPARVLVWRIADVLNQDCIAALIPNTVASCSIGFLAGPNAAPWGPFNPEFFILPTGERLAAQQARANRQDQFGSWAEQRNLQAAA